jgi:choline dehydrogenase-like flavoprotein
MLSGIGNSKELKSLGIKPIVNLPDVGQRLTDQPIISNYFQVNSNTTEDDVSRDPQMAAAALAEWQEHKTGVYANTLTEGVGFLRIPKDSQVLKTTRDPSAGPGSGHFEMIVRNGFTATDTEALPRTGHFITVSSAVLTPTSTGSVRLASADPFDFPLIDPNYFNSTFDQFVMLSAVKAARAFMSAAPWQGFVQARFGVLGGAESDEEIIAAVRKSIGTIWHPTSSARMSPRDASWGVVDPQLRVKGASGLRVVDASVFVSTASWYFGRRVTLTKLVYSLLFLLSIPRLPHTF